MKATDLPIIQLLDSQGQPWDFAVAGTEERTWSDLAALVSLTADYADGTLPYKRY